MVDEPGVFLRSGFFKDPEAGPGLNQTNFKSGYRSGSCGPKRPRIIQKNKKYINVSNAKKWYDLFGF